MIPKHIEFGRFETLKDLYNKLITVEQLKHKVKCNYNAIYIVLHNNFTITIEQKVNFYLYINGTICCKNIEEQDIWEITNNYLQENNVFVEKNCMLGKRKKILILDKTQFEEKKWKLMKNQNTKIFTIKEVIYKS